MKRFFIYGLIGCLLEVLWTGICSLYNGNISLISHTSIWMIFIYGMAIFLEPVQKIVENKNLAVRGTIYMSMIYLTEYISGFILDIFNITVWKYTDKLNIHGYITLSFVPLWFITGLFFEKIRIYLDNIKIGNKEYIKE